MLKKKNSWLKKKLTITFNKIYDPGPRLKTNTNYNFIIVHYYYCVCKILLRNINNNYYIINFFLSISSCKNKRHICHNFIGRSGTFRRNLLNQCKICSWLSIMLLINDKIFESFVWKITVLDYEGSVCQAVLGGT